MSPEFLPFGFLPLNKPVGPTSHDMVAQVRRLLPRDVKVGHTGTLDPFASGVMILALGKATRFSDDVHLLEKSYRAEILLGQRTDTLDKTGTSDLEMPVPDIDAAQLEEVTGRFLGTQQQVPPSFSAKRVKGVKSYELARQNKAVPLKPKQITISKLELELLETNRLACRLTCSTGTYVRALARDLAEALGTCGHLISLVRSSVGSVQLEDCVAPDQCNADTLPQWLLSVPKLLPSYPEIRLQAAALEAFLQGRPFPTAEALPATFLAVFEIDGQTHAIFRCDYQAVEKRVQPRLRCYLRN